MIKYEERIHMWIIGIVIVLMLYFSTFAIEKSLRTIQKQNEEVIKLLKDIKEQGGNNESFKDHN